MGTKLDQKEWPSGHGPNDFQCFGPPALKDAEFAGTKICDMGCFKQGETDSNKYYHAAVVKSKISGAFFAYFEWGRVGQTPAFQFVECSDEADAQSEYEDQLHSKNDKRGQWTTIAGLKTLEPKPGKDCYLVRPLAKRATGLPDGLSITTNDGAKSKPAVIAKKGAAAQSKIDTQTLSLMRDLNVATVAYTRSATSGGSVPTQAALDDGRTLLTEAQKRLLKVGDDIKDQANDKELVSYTSLLYSKIGKTKPVGAPPESWILSKDNIMAWQQDLDAFESALQTVNNSVAVESDPFDGMSIDMSWIDPKSSIGAWINKWAPKATRNVHGHLGSMKVHNAWRVARNGDESRLQKCQDEISAERTRGWNNEVPLFQEGGYPELDDKRKDAYKKSNSALMFHGTRSVNVSGILRKSLLLPKQLVGVVITGAMFGQGVYMADDWKKSAGYTSLDSSYWSKGSGAVKGRNAFMFVVETVCGHPFVAPGPRGYTGAPNGYHCIFGKAGHSQVQNNEWIVFNQNQFMLRYLLEFSV